MNFRVSLKYVALLYKINLKKSAGIGRTGTLVASINLIEMMNKSKIIRPKKVIQDIRKQRAFLVQNWVRTKFCFISFYDSLYFNFK